MRKRGRRGSGLLGWRRRRAIEQELAHHVEELADWLTSQGMAPCEARAEALRRFGSRDEYAARCVAVWREAWTDVRGEGVMASIRQDLAYGVRTLVRSPGFTLVVLLTLALGIGANAAIFSVVNGVLMRPLGLTAPHELVVLRESSPALGIDAAPASVPMLTDWREQVSSLRSLAGWMWTTATLQDPDRSEELQGVEASGNYFTTLGIAPQVGRLFDEGDVTLEGPTVAVISDGLWRRRFGGDPGAVGSVLRLDGGPVEVVGVMPPDHVAPSPEAEIWLPARYDAALERIPNYGARMLHAVGRLRPEATVEHVDREIRAVAERVAAESPTTSQGWSAHAVPFREDVVGSVREALLIAFASVAVLLLIACVNVANLVLSRAATREREVAVRTALGAGRARIARQLLTESVLVSVLGGVVGLAVAVGAHRLILTLEPGILPRVQAIRLDPVVIAFAVALAVVTGILFGLVPSLQASGVRTASVLKQAGGRSGTGRGHERLRRALVVAQLALTVVLLAGAGLLSRTFLALRAVDLGFTPEGVVAARVFVDRGRYRSDEAMHLYYEALLDRMAGLPGVTRVGASTSLPMDPVAVNFDLPFRTQATAGAEGGDIPQADFRVVTPGYFEALRVPLLRGRLFNDGDGPETPNVMLVNRAMADAHWPGEDPVGRRVETVFGGWDWYEIVGVVESTRYYGPALEPRPEMYVAETQSSFPSMTLIARTTGDPSALVPRIRSVFPEVDPLQPPQSVFVVEELVSASMAAERFYATLLGAFALVAMLLAVAGIYGVLSYWVSQRTREIGVRLALGAGRGSVLGQIVRDGMTVTGAGIVLGLAGTLAATRVLSNMLFGVEALDPVTLGVVASVLTLAALVACLAPGYRASRLDPVQALREE